MVELVLGILAAVGASTFYSLGIALQALDAREAPPEEHLRLALAWRLARRARWLAGTGPIPMIFGSTPAARLIGTGGGNPSERKIANLATFNLLLASTPVTAFVRSTKLAAVSGMGVPIMT